MPEVSLRGLRLRCGQCWPFQRPCLPWLKALAPPSKPAAWRLRSLSHLLCASRDDPGPELARGAGLFHVSAGLGSRPHSWSATSVCPCGVSEGNQPGVSGHESGAGGRVEEEVGAPSKLGLLCPPATDRLGHTCARAQARAQAHTHRPMHTGTHTNTHSWVHTQAHTHMHTNTGTCTRTYAHAHRHTHKHTLMGTHTGTQAHTHTRTFSASLLMTPLPRDPGLCSPQPSTLTLRTPGHLPAPLTTLLAAPLAHPGHSSLGRGIPPSWRPHTWWRGSPGVS